MVTAAWEPRLPVDKDAVDQLFVERSYMSTMDVRAHAPPEPSLPPANKTLLPTVAAAISLPGKLKEVTDHLLLEAS